MEITGLLSKQNGREIYIDNETYFLRKSLAETTKELRPGLVTITFEIVEGGFKMVSEIKPTIPSTEVEKTPAQPSQVPSQNITTADAHVKGAEFVSKAQPRSQKDMDITYSWSFNCAVSDIWDNCNDALVLNTEQKKTRVKELAAWFRNELLSR